MKNGLARMPWFVGAPVFLGALVVAALVSNYLGADYFERTRLDEVNPLAAARTPVRHVSPVPAVAIGDDTAVATVASTPSPPRPQVLAEGLFRDGEPGHRGSGTATLGRDAAGKPVIVFEDFSVTNGPGLHVILSSNPEGSGKGIDLGSLKATDGTFSYAIPEGTDLSQIKSVTIWCAAFPTIFAYATLGG